MVKVDCAQNTILKGNLQNKHTGFSGKLCRPAPVYMVASMMVKASKQGAVKNCSGEPT